MSQSLKQSVPSYRHLLWFFVPLALSSAMMTLEPLVINSALSRGPNSELSLAGYNVMFPIALVIEAPVMMLISASAALSHSRASFRRLFHFMLVLGATVVAIGFIVSLTPLYNWLVLDFMSIPSSVAQTARPALIILSMWPFPVAWRRLLQGVLIAHNRTPMVTLATIMRLGALTTTLLVGVRIMPDRPLVASAIAMLAAVITESLVVTLPAFSIVRRLPAQNPGLQLTWRRLFMFYQPLAVMMVLRQISRPLMSAGIAAAQMPERSLAAWSIAWSIVLLPFGMTMGLEQVAIAKGSTPESMAQVRRFVWGIGLTLGGVLVLIVFSPLVHPTLGLLFDLSSEIEPLVIVGLRWTATLPLFLSLQGLLRGTAIGNGRTPDVRTAVAFALAAVIFVTLVGPRFNNIDGVIIAAVATMLSAIAEIVWLSWRERRARLLVAPSAQT